MGFSTHDSLFSQFVEFIVDPLHAQDLAAALIARAERFTCFYPGFISAQVNVSEAGDRVLIQFLWSSVNHGQLAVEKAKAIEPDLFQLARQHHSRALLFSTFNTVAHVHAQPVLA